MFDRGPKQLHCIRQQPLSHSADHTLEAKEIGLFHLAVHLAGGLGFSVGFGVGVTPGRVDAIEVWRPHERDVVRYRDVDVFGLPALEVVERLRRHVTVVANDEDDGFTARELYLALYRPFAADDDPEETQGHFFQSVLVAGPGYDDTPAEAAARLAAGHEPGY